MRNLWLFNEKRLMILRELVGCGSARGCDIKEILRIKKALLSYHLGILREMRVVGETKRGRDKYYRIRRSQMPLVRQVLRAVQ